MPAHQGNPETVSMWKKLRGIRDSEERVWITKKINDAGNERPARAGSTGPVFVSSLCSAKGFQSAASVSRT
jgi:hypothetical protein